MERGEDLFSLNIWRNLKLLRDTLRGARLLNPNP
jgi:hypothetical protein